MSNLLQIQNQFDSLAVDADTDVVDLQSALLELQDDLSASGEIILADNVESILDDLASLTIKIDELALQAQSVGGLYRSHIRATEKALEETTAKIVTMKQSMLDLLYDWDEDEVEVAFKVLMDLKAADPTTRRQVLFALAEAVQ